MSLSPLPRAQIVGLLLVFALMAGPAAAAQQCTTRFWHGIVLAVALALIEAWLGVVLAFLTDWPTSFWITTLSGGVICWPACHVTCRPDRAKLKVPLCQFECASAWQMLERNATISFQGLKPTIGFAASLLAVWCQILLLATISLTPMGAGADPVGNLPICHGDDGSQPAPEPSQTDHNCAFCVCCVSHALPLAILSPVQVVPYRQSVASVRLYTAQPRAPPVRLVSAAQPRGPPSTI